jgi:hypothetical protein
MPTALKFSLMALFFFVFLDRGFAARAKKPTAIASSTSLCIPSLRAIALPPKTLNGEMTIMRGQFSQGGGVAPAIPSDNLVSTFHLHGVPGDPVFPNANGDYTNILFSSVSKQDLATPTQALSHIKPVAQLSAADKSRLVENYIRIEFSDVPYSPASLEMMVKAGKETPETIAKAMAAYERGALELTMPRQLTPESRLRLQSNSRSTSLETTTGSNSRALAETVTPAVQNKLASAGEERYFSFTPNGSNKPVAARVLDIHVKPNGQVHVYAEWMTSASNGERTREVGIVSVEELKTMSKLATGDRVNAALEFFDSLTPNQVSAQMLAQRLGLEPRGYTDFMRAPGVKSQNPQLITEKMSNLAHHSAREEAEKKFGNFNDLLTDAEKANANWNVMDVFGRLSPEYVLKRFRATNGYKYMYVVTEDGQLKICPLGPDTTNMRPQLLRLGHGRKVYSTGTFTLDESGAVHLTRRNADYTSFDGAVASGGGDNPMENRFLQAVFRMQGATDTASINTVGPTLWDEIRFNEFTGMYENIHGPAANTAARNAQYAKAKADGQKASGASPFGNYGSAEADDFMRSILKDRQASKASVPDWPRDVRGSAPPTFEEWLSKANKVSNVTVTGDVQAKLDYAHYVLGTTPNQTFKEIQEAYRQLQKKFYSRDGQDDARASQRINDAFAMFKGRRNE